MDYERFVKELSGERGNSRVVATVPGRGEMPLSDIVVPSPDGKTASLYFAGNGYSSLPTNVARLQGSIKGALMQKSFGGSEVLVGTMDSSRLDPAPFPYHKNGDTYKIVTAGYNTTTGKYELMLVKD